MGNANAAVFPLPVSASPMMSRSCRARGMACCLVSEREDLCHGISHECVARVGAYRGLDRRRRLVAKGRACFAEGIDDSLTIAESQKGQATVCAKVALSTTKRTRSLNVFAAWSSSVCCSPVVVGGAAGGAAGAGFVASDSLSTCLVFLLLTDDMMLGSRAKRSFICFLGHETSLSRDKLNWIWSKNLAPPPPPPTLAHMSGRLPNLEARKYKILLHCLPPARPHASSNKTT